MDDEDLDREWERHQATLAGALELLEVRWRLLTEAILAEAPAWAQRRLRRLLRR